MPAICLICRRITVLNANNRCATCGTSSIEIVDEGTIADLQEDGIMNQDGAGGIDLEGFFYFLLNQSRGTPQ